MIGRLTLLWIICGSLWRGGLLFFVCCSLRERRLRYIVAERTRPRRPRVLENLSALEQAMPRGCFPSTFHSSLLGKLHKTHLKCVFRKFSESVQTSAID